MDKGNSISIANLEQFGSKYISFIEIFGHILKVLGLEVSVYNVYITYQFQTTFSRGGGGGGRFVELIWNRKEDQ